MLFSYSCTSSRTDRLARKILNTFTNCKKLCAANLSSSLSFFLYPRYSRAPRALLFHVCVQVGLCVWVHEHCASFNYASMENWSARDEMKNSLCSWTKRMWMNLLRDVSLFLFFTRRRAEISDSLFLSLADG